MPFIAPEVILEAKRMDLLTYLQNFEPNELVKCAGGYTTRTHDSLKISNGKWMWWSRGFGGRTALDYLIKVKGLSFLEAVETIMGRCAVRTPVYYETEKYEEKPLLLPDKSASTDVVFEYLFRRGIDYEIIDFCLKNELIIESLPYHNVVFIGYDSEKKPKYAAYRSTNKQRIMGDCTGSKKEYSFRIVNGESREVHLFECAIDLLSYATLCKQKGIDWKKLNLVSLGGVYAPKKKIEESKVPAALEGYMKVLPNTKRVIIHFDNDIAGRKATNVLQTILSDNLEVVDEPPPSGKDFNDFLMSKMNFTQKKENERGLER